MKEELNQIISYTPTSPTGLVVGDVWYDMETGRLKFVDCEKKVLRQQRSDKIKKILKNENSNRK